MHQTNERSKGKKTGLTAEGGGTIKKENGRDRQWIKKYFECKREHESRDRRGGCKGDKFRNESKGEEDHEKTCL